MKKYFLLLISLILTASGVVRGANFAGGGVIYTPIGGGGGGPTNGQTEAQVASLIANSNAPINASINGIVYSNGISSPMIMVLGDSRSDRSGFTWSYCIETNTAFNHRANIYSLALAGRKLEDYMTYSMRTNTILPMLASGPTNKYVIIFVGVNDVVTSDTTKTNYILTWNWLRDVCKLGKSQILQFSYDCTNTPINLWLETNVSAGTLYTYVNVTNFPTIDGIHPTTNGYVAIASNATPVITNVMPVIRNPAPLLYGETVAVAGETNNPVAFRSYGRVVIDSAPFDYSPSRFLPGLFFRRGLADYQVGIRLADPSTNSFEDLEFLTQNARRMAIEQEGYVSFFYPGTKLYYAGDARTTDKSYLWIVPDTGNNEYLIKSQAEGAGGYKNIHFTGSGGADFYVMGYPSVNVGVSTNNPQSKFHVHGDGLVNGNFITMGGNLILTNNAHIISSNATAKPTLITGVGAAGGGIAAGTNIIGNDVKGRVNVSTGSAPSSTAGALIVQVNFMKNYNVPPTVTLHPTWGDTNGLIGTSQVFVTSAVSSFTITTMGGAALTANTNYAWYYHVIE